jgi:predicted DNA-binding protein with PD1-like motif
VTFSTPAGSAWAASGTMETTVNSAAAAARMIVESLLGNIKRDAINPSIAAHATTSARDRRALSASNFSAPM